MTYSVSRVLELIRLKIDSRLDIELVVSSTHQTVTRVQVTRNIPWSNGLVGGVVPIFATADNASVSFHVVSMPGSSPNYRHGCINAESAAERLIEFITSDDGGKLLNVHARTGRRPKVHTLKCLPGVFHSMVDGMKTFEFRRDDRNFEAGDVLDLCEWQPKELETEGRFTGNHAERVVTYKLGGGLFGVPEGFCVLSIAPL